MLTITHFIFLFAISFGLVAIYITYQLYKEYGLKYLLSYIYILVFFNIINIAHFFETFLKHTSRTVSDNLILYFTVIPVLLSIIRLMLAYHFTFFLWGLMERRWLQSFKLFFSGITLLYLFVNAIALFSPIHREVAVALSYKFVHLFLFSVVTLGLLIVFYSSIDIKFKGRKNAIFFLPLFLLASILYFS